MSLGNQIKNKKETTPQRKVKTLELDVNDEAILKGIIMIVAENVGKFGLSAEQVGNVYSNCHSFINIINSLESK